MVNTNKQISKLKTRSSIQKNNFYSLDDSRGFLCSFIVRANKLLTMNVNISVMCIPVLCEQKIHVSIKNKHKMTARSCMRANAILQAFFFNI